jgi:hypothetical protein
VLVATVALLLLVLLAVFLLWIALWLVLIVGAIGAVILVNLVFLPWLAARVGLSASALTLLVLPPLIAAPWLLTKGPLGGAAGLAFWLALFALPRAALSAIARQTSWKIEFRVGQRPPPTGSAVQTRPRRDR